jgi:hypothetical protein
LAIGIRFDWHREACVVQQRDISKDFSQPLASPAALTYCMVYKLRTVMVVLAIRDIRVLYP